MSRRIRMLGGILAAASLLLVAPDAYAQVESGSWKTWSPGYNVQQVGCGSVSGSTFKLTCSNSSGEQRAERRYDTYSGGTHQFEGYFKINSMGGSRISLKQTFGSGPFFLLAVESGGRMYSVEGGATISGGATVGTTVRVNTVNQVGSTHRTYINGSLKNTVNSPSGSYYDKLGAYRTASGQGPISVTWSNIRFWTK
ncbi:hypothetical protein BJ998_005401 [Kutzneria kofuensis]|uniref:Uncharacterized protein n=2 Tax=Kutzneria kofuensis TaxID=103725 RepID=A0A7W9KKP3_9PSEU|nr:hypothetical protein [Kutzneria kofuensis]